MNAAEKTRAALDQLDELHSALAAIADLSTPGDDLHTVNRNNLAMLLGLLLRLQGEATQRAWEGFQALREPAAPADTRLAAIADLLCQARATPEEG